LGSLELTPVSQFDGWYAKREDLASWVSLDHPSGSKVRQYMAMAKDAPGAPMIVGCASYSCMQVYVASAAKLTGVPAHVFVPKRNRLTEASEYAAYMGAIIHLVAPSWGNVLRSRARDFGKQFPKIVRWNPRLALKDAMTQCANIPDDVKRVIVPTGSGLTAAGVLAGLALKRKRPLVLAIAVSELANDAKIMKLAAETVGLTTGRLFNHHLPNFSLKRAAEKYGEAMLGWLPDGTPLDPYYAAKAVRYVQPGDCLWLPGLRPLRAMPEPMRGYFKWEGFK